MFYREEARWENIRKNAQADDIKVRLDNILELLENTYPELQGPAAAHLRRLEPRPGKRHRADQPVLQGHLSSGTTAREDLIGRVYEYFIGEFASSEGKRGGEYFTPSSIVRLLVRMLEPESGTVFDPCCGSGGMFVQSDVFTHHSRSLSFFGQEIARISPTACAG